MSETAKYTRNNPYQATVTVNELLTAEGSEKETRHIELALEEGMHYTPGDAVGILPTNRDEAVEEVLKALGFTGDERVLDHYKVEISFLEALRSRLTIGVLTRGAINQYAKLAPTVEGLKHLSGLDNKARAEEYCYGREFIDLATEFPGVITDPQQMFQVVGRLVPRMYSIASSIALHPGAVQTTVRVVRYDSHSRTRQGVASGHLGERAPVGATMPIFLHGNNNFRLPENPDTPVIMVGPGTGIAPFRSFLEERKATGAKGQNWLFFGEQRKALDFLYQDELEGMVKDGILTHLDTAFSRDQQKKVYVQDRMQEKSAELFEWLERGAHFYVCGDASRMAKDVHTALLDAIAKGSNGTLEHAEAYLNQMKKDKRYQLDVY
ncbi:sulfite reductase (NADPH) flavoprotein alpha-component [Granulicella rosea]|uniref:assimilatory sulfite reductase (NADPH) n=1 Tax=Granulicella rosea TaxID=474952 RepID=A0A239DZV8_9BACT|nr:oxidoreductase [Granulicella rosea]SNS37174.1 sulfite reductase (NADPH) flavoprotein alpha-component [Granulicella rosea]